MDMRRHLALPLAVLPLTLPLLLAAFPASADEGWRLARSEDGVSVWKRPEPGSPIEAFRAETVVQSRLAALLTLFYDLDAAPRWLDHTRRVEALERDDQNHSYVLHLETSLPWPLRDRDAVIIGRWWQDPATHVVYLRGHRAPRGSYPGNHDYLRYYDMRSDWTFVPLDGGRVRVIMEGHADPAGSMPKWAVNMLIQESPLRTLRNLRQIIGQQKYQNSHVEGIDMADATTEGAVASQP
jgi:hypothetical protein